MYCVIFLVILFVGCYMCFYKCFCWQSVSQ